MANPGDTLSDGQTELNLGTGGSLMDESVPEREDGDILHRPRIVIAGDAEEGAIVDPVAEDVDVRAYALPTRDPLMPEVVQLLTRIACSLEKIQMGVEMICSGELGE